MKNKRSSLKDIAAALNVSVTTVSFVLNGKAEEKRISDAVTHKVLEYIKKIDYRPNQLAQSLRTGKSRILVLMVEDISNSFFARIARIIEDLAYEKGYKVLFCSNENQDDKSKELITLFNERQVDGYIIVPSPGIKNTIKNLIDDKIPVVLFDRYFPDLDANYVIIDNERSAFNATNHLIENQFREIGFITIDVAQTQMEDRLKGYKKAIGTHNLKENVLVIPYKEGNKRIKKEIIKDFFVKNTQLDAVFFATNYLTQTGLEIMKEELPDLKHKWGIVTFDDNEYFKIHTPSISAVSQPLEEIGRELMEIMWKLLQSNSDRVPVRKKILKTELQVRESSNRKEKNRIL